MDNTALQHVIYNGLSVEPEYNDKVTVFVDQVTGEYDMSIHNVQLNESGWYVCLDDGSSINVHPHLITVRGKYLHAAVRLNVLANSNKRRVALVDCEVMSHRTSVCFQIGFLRNSKLIKCGL